MREKQHLTVVAAVIEKDGNIVVCQRHEHDAFGTLWEFPGGVVEQGETLEQALAREIAEELGVEIQIGDFLGVFEDENETLKITVHVFRVLIIAGQLQPLDCAQFRLSSISGLDSFELAPLDLKVAAYLKEN